MPRLVVMLDFQNLGVSANDVSRLDDWVKERVAPARSEDTKELFKAFYSPYQQAAAMELRQLKWKVVESNTNSDPAIIHHSKSDCGHDSTNTTFVLISRNGDFAPLIKTLREWGVSVYVAGPQDTSQRLIQAAGDGRWWQMPLIWPSATAQVVGGTASLDRLLGLLHIRP